MNEKLSNNISEELPIERNADFKILSVREKIRKNPERYLSFYQGMSRQVGDLVNGELTAKNTEESQIKVIKISDKKYEYISRKQIEKVHDEYKKNQRLMEKFLKNHVSQDKLQSKLLSIESQGKKIQLASTSVEATIQEKQNFVEEILKNLSNEKGVKRIFGEADIQIVPGGLVIGLDVKDLINVLGISLETSDGQIIDSREMAKIVASLENERGGFGITLSSAELKKDFQNQFGGKIIFANRYLNQDKVILHEIKEILADYYINEAEEFEQIKLDKNVEPDVNSILRNKLADLAARIEDGDDLSAIGLEDIGFRVSEYNNLKSDQDKLNYIKSCVLSILTIKASERYLQVENNIKTRSELANLIRTQFINPADFLALTENIGKITDEEKQLLELLHALQDKNSQSTQEIIKLFPNIISAISSSSDDEIYHFNTELKGRMINDKRTLWDGDILEHDGVKYKIGKILGQGGFGATYEVTGVNAVIKELLWHTPEWLFAKISKTNFLTFDPQKYIDPTDRSQPNLGLLNTIRYIYNCGGYGPFKHDRMNDELELALTQLRDQFQHGQLSKLDFEDLLRSTAEDYKQKLCSERSSIEGLFNEEYAILNRLWSSGASVPKPIGIKRIPEYEAGVAENQKNNYYLIMEKAKGQSLTSELATNIPWSQDDVANFAKLVLSTLDKVHQTGIIHKDLKPANIFIERDQQGKIIGITLIDFGISKGTIHQNISGISRSGTQKFGTPGFAAPEQVTGYHITDGRTDLYALGKVLYEMISANNPCSDNFFPKADELANKIRLSNPKVSDDFLNFIKQLVEPDINKRFKDSADALNFLNHVKKYNGVPNTPKIAVSPSVSHSPKPPQPRPTQPNIIKKFFNMLGPVPKTALLGMAIIGLYFSKPGQDFQRKEINNYFTGQKSSVQRIFDKDKSNDFEQNIFGPKIRFPESDGKVYYLKDWKNFGNEYVNTHHGKKIDFEDITARVDEFVMGGGLSEFGPNALSRAEARAFRLIFNYHNERAKIDLNNPYLKVKDGDINNLTPNQAIKLAYLAYGQQKYEDPTYSYVEIFNAIKKIIPNNLIDLQVKRMPTEREAYVAFLEHNNGKVEELHFSLPDSQSIDKNFQVKNNASLYKYYECLKVLPGHTKPINSIIESRDGKNLISASDDGYIRIWDKQSGNCIKMIHRTGSIDIITESLDGNKIIALVSSGNKFSKEYDISINDKKTGEKLKELYCSSHRFLYGRNRVPLMEFADDKGKYIIWVENSVSQKIKIWDQKSDKCNTIVVGDSQQINSLSISSDKKNIVLSNDHDVKILDRKTGECLNMIKRKDKEEFTYACESRDGKSIIAITDEKELKIYNINNDRLITKFSIDDGYDVESISESPDDKDITIAYKNGISKTWNKFSGFRTSYSSDQDIKFDIWSREDHKSIIIRDNTTRGEEITLKELIVEGNNQKIDNAFRTKDGNNIVSTTTKGEIRIWGIDQSKKHYRMDEFQ